MSHRVIKNIKATFLKHTVEYLVDRIFDDC